jgi:hypothetical protein
MNIIRRSDVACGKLGWDYVLGEVKELLEEVMKLDWNGIKSELLDVFSCGQIAFWDWVRVDGLVIETENMRIWKERKKWWVRFLTLRGIEFRMELLRHGGNHARWEKVLRVWKEGMDEITLSSEDTSK